jgi:hypothetical protein
VPAVPFYWRKVSNRTEESPEAPPVRSLALVVGTCEACSHQLLNHKQHGCVVRGCACQHSPLTKQLALPLMGEAPTKRRVLLKKAIA